MERYLVGGPGNIEMTWGDSGEIAGHCRRAVCPTARINTSGQRCDDAVASLAVASLGLRLLAEDRMNSMMEHIDSIMADSSFQPFHFASRHSARVLSGEEEGVFAWIAVNYLLGVFSNDRSNLLGLIIVLVVTLWTCYSTL